MPRRNGKPARSRTPQVSKRGVFSRGAVTAGSAPTWHPDLETPVEADGRCGGRPDGKLRFLTEDIADAALKQAQRRRNWQNNPHREERFYECSNCGAYHLTSEPLKKAPNE